MAQTYSRGPLTANGSGKALTPEEMDQVRADLADFKAKHGVQEPARSFMDDPDVKWRFGGPPDYSLTNYLYLKQRTKIHPEGSLEQVVENLVKTWEMERSHKLDPNQHRSVDTERFRIGANGWRKYDNIEANKVGNYNVLMSGVDPKLWDGASTTWEDSHHMWHTAFAAFPWELLEVFSGPPTVGFSWRHWGAFTGAYEGHQGSGELVELYGFGTATVNDKLQLVDVDIYYKAEPFLEVMKGMRPASDLGQHNVMGRGCPVMGEMYGGSCPVVRKKASPAPPAPPSDAHPGCAVLGERTPPPPPLLSSALPPDSHEVRPSEAAEDEAGPACKAACKGGCIIS